MLSPGELISFTADHVVLWDNPEVDMSVMKFTPVGRMMTGHVCLVLSVTESHSFLSDIMLMTSDGVIGWVTMGPHGIKRWIKRLR